ncbi:flagellar basal body P-ring formation protein FlgA [Pseudomonas lalucatii]|uniref:Flagella basal body P-ring formation protein FlgA n=1 Tax=Pseudomonas lalucatii TaxID=1424203 RepID=A0ABS5Q2U9_9PSED|nr:flagellar basal body P-ring formation chaperone FlgA [Pseudomonas lalucatii]MBS7663090.1 flagellar basal body P-ring formation protein FlgA [Pseudomonas lalucatii]MBS7690025.1 flagellar basal body P-ring formation protein FlgA [Pseudomonas lalucatii]MBS7724824.1 flagellar basal body P-ring formation protein FlgA [Pseudomonas lalucatii]
MNAETTIFRHALIKGCQLLAVLPAMLVLGYSPQAAAATLPEQLIGTTQRFLEHRVAEYLQRSDIRGRHEIQINRLDPRLRLPACDQDLTASLENPADPIGRVTVRVRCPGSAPWTVFVPGQVRLFRDVVIANRPLKRNSVLTERDVTLAERDLGSLSQGYLTAAGQAVGKKLTRPLLPDQVVMPIHVEAAEVIHRGDQVVIVARSGTVNVRMPGEALSDGAVGRQIRVRNQRSQRVIRARVVGPGQVEVAM